MLEQLICLVIVAFFVLLAIGIYQDIISDVEQLIPKIQGVINMTVKELKERLNQFHDNCIVCIPNEDRYRLPGAKDYVVALNVAQGCNEFDGLVFIDDYVEDDEDDY